MSFLQLPEGRSLMRIRTIKPEFWSSEGVASLPLPARLTFIGLWQLADDHGCGKANPKLIKAALWPLDQNITAEQVAGWMDELEEAGLIRRYTEGGRDYYTVSSWEKHQAAAYRRGERQHPAPPSVKPARQNVQMRAGREGKGREGKGSGKEESKNPATPPISNALAEALLAPDSRAQYLHGRLVQTDERWRKVTPAALMKFGREYGADLVITALAFCYEEGATPFEPFPYLESICVRIRDERQTG
jgi:hypothetical protein